MCDFVQVVKCTSEQTYESRQYGPSLSTSCIVRCRQRTVRVALRHVVSLFLPATAVTLLVSYAATFVLQGSECCRRPLRTCSDIGPPPRAMPAPLPQSPLQSYQSIDYSIDQSIIHPSLSQRAPSCPQNRVAHAPFGLVLLFTPLFTPLFTRARAQAACRRRRCKPTRRDAPPPWRVYP